MKRIVLDTNCLLASLSLKGNYYVVWQSLKQGRYILCVSNDIIQEYREIIAQKTNSTIADNVIRYLEASPFVLSFDPYYHFNLIKTDTDDNKFVDCAVIANATFIVSEDNHFNVLQYIDFPKVNVIRLNEFVKLLQ